MRRDREAAFLFVLERRLEVRVAVLPAPPAVRTKARISSKNYDEAVRVSVR
jgi:hypothetical protein